MSDLLLAAQKGLLFPQFAIQRMLNGNDIDTRMEKNAIRSKILVLLQDRQMRISEISDGLKIEPEAVIEILKELKNEKRIRAID